MKIRGKGGRTALPMRGAHAAAAVCAVGWGQWRSGLHHFEDGVAGAEVVVGARHLQTGLFDLRDHAVGMVHLAVAVGHGGEVDTRHRQAERSCLEALPIPEGFHDVKVRGRRHHRGGASEDGANLRFREAIEELAHPNDVPRLTLGQRGIGRQEVGGVGVDAVGAGMVGHVAAHHVYLAGEVDDGDLHLWIVRHAA